MSAIGGATVSSRFAAIPLSFSFFFFFASLLFRFAGFFVDFVVVVGVVIFMFEYVLPSVSESLLLPVSSSINVFV